MPLKTENTPDLKNFTLKRYSLENENNSFSIDNTRKHSPNLSNG